MNKLISSMENQKHKIKPTILLKKSLMALTVIILVIQLGIVCINSFKARRNCELNVHRDTIHTFHIIQERERRNKRGLEEESENKIKYLEYVSHDGFGNQLRSLRNAILLSWLLNRTLIVPSEYSHEEALVRGNCLFPSEGMIMDQTEIIQASKDLDEKLIFEERYLSFLKIFNFSLVEEYINVVDGSKFHFQRSQLSIYTVPEDCCTCPNVIWTTGNGAPDYDPENPIFKDILTTFQNRTEDILQFGSLYPPANASLHLTFSFISGFYDKTIFAMANPPYRDEIIQFGKRIVVTIKKKWQMSPVCIHFRAGDAQFALEYEKTLNYVMSEALNSTFYSPCRPIIFITDAIEEDKERALGHFHTIFSRIYTIDNFRSLQRETNKQLGFHLDVLHYEQILCACTSGFIGHPGSTFSQRIEYMMKKNICKLESHSLGIEGIGEEEEQVVVEEEENVSAQ